MDGGEVGHLTEKLEEEDGLASLEADIHNPGYAVGLRDSETGSVALIHPDGDPVKIVSEFRKLRRSADFGEAVIAAAEKTRELGWIVAYLKNRVEEVRVVNPGGGKGLGVDGSGFYFPTNPETGIEKDNREAVEGIGS